MKFESRPVLDDISIVIPTLGREILEQSSYWILAGGTWPGCLIVVEQGANPDVVSWLNRVREIGFRVKHNLSSQRGRSAGINRGLEQVDTRFVAITDDNCVVAKDYLRQSPGAVITGRVEDADDLRRGDDVLREAISSLIPAQE